MPKATWPADTPAEIAHIADELVELLDGRDGRLVAPALAMVFSYVIVEIGRSQPGDVMRAVGRVAIEHGAIKPREWRGREN
jgi:hypothetical protein